MDKPITLLLCAYTQGNNQLFPTVTKIANGNSADGSDITDNQNGECINVAVEAATRLHW